MGNLWALFLKGTAIKGLPYSIGHLTRLDRLNLDNCRNLRSLPNSLCGLKSLNGLSLNGCSNLEAFSEINEDMEQLECLFLRETGITELPSSIEHLRCLKSLELFSCENLVALPDSIGNLTCLTALRVRHCSMLQYLPDNLRSLQCCLKELDLGGCINLKEGQIPSDFWCLSLLERLDISENHMCCIPSGIIQLCKLQTLMMNHCPMLKEIGELPSSLTEISAHGCPFLEIETSSSLLWSSLLKSFKSPIQRRVDTVVPGSSAGIPGWVSHQRMGSEIRIELPMNWYEDDNFLGFALFFYHVPVDDEHLEAGLVSYPIWELISHDNQSEQWDGTWWLHSSCKTYCIGGLSYSSKCYESGSTKDPAIQVIYFPRMAIPSDYRCRRWNNFKAYFYTQIGSGSFSCGDDACFKVKSCGVHLIYAQDQNNWPQPSN